MRTHTGRNMRRKAGARLTANGTDVATGTNVRPENAETPKCSKNACHSPGSNGSLQRHDTSINTSQGNNHPAETPATGRTCRRLSDNRSHNRATTSATRGEES